jgi:hypothetical protein
VSCKGNTNEQTTDPTPGFTGSRDPKGAAQTICQKHSLACSKLATGPSLAFTACTNRGPPAGIASGSRRFSLLSACRETPHLSVPMRLSTFMDIQSTLLVCGNNSVIYIGYWNVESGSLWLLSHYCRMNAIVDVLPLWVFVLTFARGYHFLQFP